MLMFLVHYRGMAAEKGLLETLGEQRLAEIYDGDEPRFSELEEIATILTVPISAFQITSPGDFAELEIAFAEVLYAARSLSPSDREALATRIVKLVRSKGQEPTILEIKRRKKSAK